VERRFDGFPPGALTFLKELWANNRRDWFEGHQQDYSEFILKPAQAFTAALGERLKEISGDIQYDTRTNGRGSIKRIHRDIRFSKDKTPYKTYVGIVFWEGKRESAKTENPAFYFRLDSEGGAMFAGMHNFPRPLLQRYRDAVVDEEQGDKLQQAISAVTESGSCEVGGEHYKRVPPGYDKTHPRAGLLRFNALFASSPVIDPRALNDESLVDTCFEYCRTMAPVFLWLTDRR
jgi:uncharacterized protein (TIGR02453 family)